MKNFCTDFSHFDKELFDADQAKVDFNTLANNDDINCNMNNIIKALQEITNKHAPIKKVTNSKNHGYLTVYLSKLKQNKSCSNPIF